MILEDLPDKLADETFELCAQRFRQMHADVPMEEALLLIGLLDTAKVVRILEQKDAPVLCRNELKELEHRLVKDLLDDEVDMVLSFLKVTLACMQPDFVEVSVDDLTPELLELMDQAQE